MKPFHRTFALIFFLVVLSGCIRDVELDLKNTKQEFVLNCILNTQKDTITADFTKTEFMNSASKSFKFVKDAEIVLFENDISVGSFSFSDSGTYYLPYNPRPGTKYRLEANIGNKKIWGETTVPKTIEAVIEKLASSMEGYQVSFKDNKDEDNFYWVSAVGYEQMLDTTQKDTTVFYTQKNIAGIIFSSFEYADDFNRYISENGVFKFEYDYYLRFPDNQLPQNQIEILFRPQCISMPMEVFLLSADYHLDKYMKSSLLTERMEIYAEDMPFIYAPFPIYSNIHGGTGNFGSFTSVSKEFSRD